MEINKRYQGQHAAAIITYKGMYNLQVAFNIERLTNLHLKLVPSRRYKVVKRFDGINPKSFEILREAARKLESGEQVNLENLLK